MNKTIRFKKWSLEASSISRLRQKTIGSTTSKRWIGFMVVELRDEGKN
jgi:hypothetical protein